MSTALIPHPTLFDHSLGRPVQPPPLVILIIDLAPIFESYRGMQERRGEYTDSFQAVLAVVRRIGMKKMIEYTLRSYGAGTGDGQYFYQQLEKELTHEELLAFYDFPDAPEYLDDTVINICMMVDEILRYHHRSYPAWVEPQDFQIARWVLPESAVMVANV